MRLRRLGRRGGPAGAPARGASAGPAAFAHRLALAALGLALAAAPARAEVPSNSQATLMLKILSFDRQLAQRAGDRVRIAVVYREGSSQSEAASSEISAALDSVAQRASVAKLPVAVVRVPYTGAARLDADLQKAKVTAAYLCAGLEDDLGAISSVTRSRGALSFSGTETFVKKAGASVGLVSRGAKAAILVQLEGSRAEGADLDSALLRIAEILR